MFTLKNTLLTFLLLTITISLNAQNVINNNTDNEEYTLIAKKGLEELNINNVNIAIFNENSRVAEHILPDNVRSIIYPSMEGSTTNFILILNEEKMRFSDELIIAHELIHLNQMISGRLKPMQGSKHCEFDGYTYNLNVTTYKNRPWEREAFDKQKKLALRIK